MARGVRPQTPAWCPSAISQTCRHRYQGAKATEVGGMRVRLPTRSLVLGCKGQWRTREHQPCLIHGAATARWTLLSQEGQQRHWLALALPHGFPTSRLAPPSLPGIHSRLPIRPWVLSSIPPYPIQHLCIQAGERKPIEDGTTTAGNG